MTPPFSLTEFLTLFVDTHISSGKIPVSYVDIYRAFSLNIIDVEAEPLLVIVTSSGVSFATQKQFTRTFPQASAHTYTFYSLLISVALLLAMSFFVNKGTKIKERAKQIAPLTPWIILMAICFYSVTFFQTKAANLLDAVVMYPIYNATLLAAGNFMAWFCFSEKPSKNSIIGVILVFATIVLSRM